VKVVINAERPRKGTFEIRVRSANGDVKTVLSLVGLKRPFPALKALDMDDVGAQVVAAIGDN
jgi:hypothetical protein